jgi:hypothetical protein
MNSFRLPEWSGSSFVPTFFGIYIFPSSSTIITILDRLLTPLISYNLALNRNFKQNYQFQLIYAPDVNRLKNKSLKNVIRFKIVRDSLNETSYRRRWAPFSKFYEKL